MVRTKNEILDTTKNLFKDSTSEEVIGFIEDISDTLDSLNVNPSDYVSKEEYNSLNTKYENLRANYINRFYDNSGSSSTLIEGSAPQDELENEEHKITYADLFE